MYYSASRAGLTDLANPSPLMPVNAIYEAFKGTNCKIPFPVLTNQNKVGCSCQRHAAACNSVYEGDLNLWKNPREQSVCMRESGTSLILEEDCTVKTSIFGLTIPGHGGTTLELLSPGTNDLVMGQSCVRGETLL